MAHDERTGDAATDRALRTAADRLLMRMTRHSGHWVALLSLASVTGAAADIAFPAVLGHTVDVMLRTAVWPSGPGGPADRWLAGCAALIALIVACSAAGQLATGMCTAAGTAWTRQRLVGHVFCAGLRLGRRFGDGDIVSRLVGGTAEAGAAAAGGVLAVAAVIPPVGSIVALALIDPWLAVAFAAGLPVLAVMLRSFVRDVSDNTVSYQRAHGEIAARLLDALAGARTIAASGTRDQETARVLTPLAEVRRHGREFWRIQARVAAQGSLVVPLLQVVVLAVAGLELAAHRISPGELLAAGQYAVIGAGVGAAIGRLSQLGRARAGARRVAEPLAEPTTRHGTAALPPGPGRLKLSGITVRSGGDLILDGLHATVPGGALVAVVGRSGAGKSMLAAVAGRLLDPDQGEVTLDGVPLATLDAAALRRAIVCAFDKPALFGGTPREAIEFGAPVPRPERLLAAARDASAMEFLRLLPAGLDTPLGQAPMSGGEIQRIGLARAFAHADEARLLILDDATSSLDTVTEMRVSAALTGHLSDRTRLIISGRATTAARADLVAWLERGRLRALAPHRELWLDPGYRAVFAPEMADA
ncbi:MAG TPA: ABC transporter ATP-binding protein [Streptosporangiaceae bacterium]|nr:ABC transporter ATP-binding protein [Streptosporangiaceae bacterium]